jgi:organic radical activating enzyme
MIRALLQFSFLFSQAQAVITLAITAKTNTTATAAVVETGASTKDKSLALTIKFTGGEPKLADAAALKALLKVKNGELGTLTKKNSLEFTGDLKSTTAGEATVVSIEAKQIGPANGAAKDNEASDLFTWTKTSKGVMTGVTYALAFLVACASIQ